MGGDPRDAGAVPFGQVRRLHGRRGRGAGPDHGAHQASQRRGICILDNIATWRLLFRSRFNVAGVAEGDVEFVYLHRRRFVEARLYPAFTLLGQSLGSVWLGG